MVGGVRSREFRFRNQTAQRHDLAYERSGGSPGPARPLTLGAGIDTQDNYRALAGGLYIDRRAGPGVVTFQVDAIKRDGGTFLCTLPKQTTLLVEGGYHLPSASLTPNVQVATQRFSDEVFEANDQTRTQVGIGPGGGQRS